MFIKNPGAKADKENKKFFIADRAKSTITCGHCSKPRILFFKAKVAPLLPMLPVHTRCIPLHDQPHLCEPHPCQLTSSQKEAVQKASDTNIYTCGARFEDAHEDVHTLACVEESLTCESTIQFSYYR